jgi:U4/U6.U5 tri-snRNP-associated protein 1
MDVDRKPIIPRARDLDTNFVDDDDLQAALARSRKAKLHKAKKQTPEQLAQKSTPFIFHCLSTNVPSF